MHRSDALVTSRAVPLERALTYFCSRRSPTVLNMWTLCSFNDVEKRFLIPSEAVPCTEQPEF